MPQVEIKPSPFVTKTTASAPAGAVTITKTLQQLPAVSTRVQVGAPA